MSELILPEHVARKVKAKSAVPETKAEVSPVESAYVKQEELYLDPTKMDMSAIERLPKPTGWRMLVLPFRGQGKTQGNVYLPDEYVERQTLATVVGYVLHMGADCYTDKDKFPGGPWCQKGDWVLFGRYAGARFKIEGGEVRILNDDEIIATIADPKDVLNV